MNPPRQKRRVQIVCAALLHIPLVAIAAYALANGIGDHVGVLTVGLISTVAATVMIVPYIGRIIDSGRVQAAN